MFEEVKNYDQIMQMVAESYIDGYNPYDSDKEVEAWLHDTYPEFKFSVDQYAIAHTEEELNAVDILEREIIRVFNERELENNDFIYTNDQWVTKK